MKKKKRLEAWVTFSSGAVPMDCAYTPEQARRWHMEHYPTAPITRTVRMIEAPKKKRVRRGK